jgi:hypothetical protein
VDARATIPQTVRLQTKQNKVVVGDVLEEVVGGGDTHEQTHHAAVLDDPGRGARAS